MQVHLYSILEMKPKNKYQERLVQLSQKLRPLTKSQIEYANSHIFPLLAYRNKKKGWCTHCGSPLEFDKDSKAKYVNCPHCGKRLEIECKSDRKYTFRAYFTVVCTFGGHQVVRHFFCTKRIHRGLEPEYEYCEVVQNWITPEGKETILARSTIPFLGYYDFWNSNSDLSIKYRRGYYSYYGSRYDIENTVIYPHVGLLKEVKRNGIKSLKEYDHIPANKILSAVLSDRETEVLVKHGQKALITHKIRGCYKGVEALKHPEAVRIACRHRYIVKDATLLLDYISLLEHFGYDTHNPHYVCPLNLHEAHDRLMIRKNREDAKAKREKEIQEAHKHEQHYKESKAPYFGIVFGDENIVISVVQSVEEMAIEGEELHHCVFAMKYYNKEKSLILSARDKEGNRIETIEVNLETFQVVQSRGVCNKNSCYHDRILKLMEENMHLIRKCA